MARQPVVTVRDALERHIELRTAVGDYTLKRYATSLDRHFAGELGPTLIADLDYEGVVYWVRVLQSLGLAPKTVRNYFGFLSSAMKTAVRLSLRADNPCYGIPLPSSDSVEAAVRVITRDEWARIYANLDPHYRPFFQFLLVTGMRFSEATALTGSDFNYSDSPVLVNVSKAWKEDGLGNQVLGPPKTTSSRRKIALSSRMAGELVPLVREAGAGLVFRNKVSGQIMSSAAHKNWSPACYAAGFTKENKPRIHALRHTSSSMFLQGGARYALPIQAPRP
ncbi:tyrosine-type recombinase/integrase [Arthrobacter burdickii]|uniref:Tyrosine-type recombinase/integrase n=1 Tax=Arthrobacter burdickii TaxID=3035920 RepID=A0ABT8K3Y6_9MICC|nr:tyrosine-type recombinase/integrase [Arthrobacter burdickii]MDN4611069.1 tyrosine-type recombinase/integrase [Arthrobacter burdickii]